MKRHFGDSPSRKPPASAVFRADTDERSTKAFAVPNSKIACNKVVVSFVIVVPFSVEVDQMKLLATLSACLQEVSVSQSNKSLLSDRTMDRRSTDMRNEE